MFKVTYTVKNETGFLVDKSKNFEMLQDAFKFVRELKSNSKMVGKPIIERN
jgi:hypothetical protein